MLIANPIYDVVFKRLMEDPEIATFFIETLLQQKIEDVRIQPQEYTYIDKIEKLSFFRLDFVATLLVGDGTRKKILIEIQKAKNEIDVMRFRNYLGEHYKKEDEVETDEGTVPAALPIVTIYLLGFKLPEIESSAVKINRLYVDLITGKVLPKKNDFIEKLTHDCIIVQLPRIHGPIRTPLDKLLSVFEQADFIDDKRLIKSYEPPRDDVQIDRIANTLSYLAADGEERKEMENEREAQRIIQTLYNEKILTIATLKKSIKEKDLSIQEKDQSIQEKELTIQEKDRILREKERQIEELLAKLQNSDE